MKKLLLTSLIILSLVAVFIYKSNKKDLRQGYVFGTYYKITTLGENNAMPQIEALFEEVNAKMSIFQADSEINKLNKAKAFQKVEISKELSFVLAQSKAIFEQSQGTFDPSLGTLIDAWGFGLKDTQKDLSPTQVQDALLDVGMDKVLLEGTYAIKTRDNLRLNLSAIAKGYAVDRIAQILTENGYDNFIIDIGGEVYAKGSASIFGKAWTVAIQHPEDANSALMSFELNNMSIATSGDYAKFIEKNGERYSHTLDPKTGEPAKNKLASVSVLHPSNMLADAYATSLMAMGEPQALAFAKTHNIHAIFIIHDKDSFIIATTP